MARLTAKERLEQMTDARERLGELISPGDTIYCILRSVARSGMSRRLDVYVIQAGSPRFITPLVARALGYSWNPEREGLRVPGCGFDAGFEVAHGLSYALHGHDDVGDSRYRAGYSLRHEWL